MKELCLTFILICVNTVSLLTNAGNLPSGVYFYVLMTDEGIYTDRAVYVK